MKNRFSTLDLRASIAELQEKYHGMRVVNVYDVDSKTYLIKLARPDQKVTILLESGIRIHSTEFEWPKNITPSSFSMKLRKHLRTRRLEKIVQLGIDRIIDLQFGSNEAAYHIILELYDRGNIVLTDHEFTILTILRPRTDQSEDVRFAVHQKYPVESAKQHQGVLPQERLKSLLLEANEGDNLKKLLNPHLVYGPALIEHSLQHAGIQPNARLGKEFNISEDMPQLMSCLKHAESLMESAKSGLKGYIIQKKEKKASMTGEDTQTEELLTYSEFHPCLFKQHENQSFVEMASFDKAVDEFFSNIGSQKLDMKALQQERAALKKLDHIKKDHVKRLEGLQQEQDVDMNKANLVEMNLDLVDRAIVVVRSAIANQIDWEQIHTIVKEAQTQGDPVASSIKNLKLDTNHITVFLKNPYLDSDEEEDSSDVDAVTPMKIDIDLALSAYANARKYFDKKRKAAVKEQKTVDASTKALKSAEKKTFQTLKEAQTVASINKARKTFWFEKFLWFISSENFVVIGGRDQQQNEHIVKKYLRAGDLYVHADLHGASSVIIKNHTGEAVPPKTLNEAGTMALCNSAAWDARVVTSAWWVHHHQVSKTAPSGEFLTTGSFMIRGKKNYLPPSYLIYGFGFMFKVDEDSLFRHHGERRVKTLEDDMESLAASESTDVTAESNDQELQGDDSSDSDNESHDGDGQITDASKAETVEMNENNIEDQLGNVKLETVEEAGSLPDDDKDDDRDDDRDDDGDEEDEANLFPDTSIGVQYVAGGKLRVQASKAESTCAITGSGGTPDNEDVAEQLHKPTGGARLTAKQRRELKKKKAREGLQQDTGDGSPPDTLPATGDSSPPDTLPATADSTADRVTSQADTLEDGPDTEEQMDAVPKCDQSAKSQSDPLQIAAKRRQKAKLKKIKEKYKDQDDEERQLRMEILASAGEPKEDKKKAKKNKQKIRQEETKRPPGSKYPPRRLTVDDIKEEAPTITQGALPGSVPEKEEDYDSDEEKQALLEGENIQSVQERTNELDSLTGLPVLEDILHFCVPVCAPYSAILNYKHKVKLTPGTTRRGKAAKTALHNFQHDKNTTSREKDLFKSLKDVDISRNIPGKVKVSAPHLQKKKK